MTTRSILAPWLPFRRLLVHGTSVESVVRCSVRADDRIGVADVSEGE